MHTTTEKFYDPIFDTFVVFDDEVAVEIPAHIDPEILKERIGHYEKAGIAPEDLGVQVTVMVNRAHPRFTSVPTKAQNDWAWLSTLGGEGNSGLTAEEFGAMVMSIDFDAPAKAL